MRVYVEIFLKFPDGIAKSRVIAQKFVVKVDCVDAPVYGSPSDDPDACRHCNDETGYAQRDAKCSFKKATPAVPVDGRGCNQGSRFRNEM